MLQTACLPNATQRSNRHRCTVLSGDNDSRSPLRVRPDLMRTPLPHDLPACLEKGGTNLAVLLRHDLTVRAVTDVGSLYDVG
jgi:hypothetical protein